jgi:hypothetical protein
VLEIRVLDPSTLKTGRPSRYRLRINWLPQTPPPAPPLRAAHSRVSGFKLLVAVLCKFATWMLSTGTSSAMGLGRVKTPSYGSEPPTIGLIYLGPARLSNFLRSLVRCQPHSNVEAAVCALGADCALTP